MSTYAPHFVKIATSRALIKRADPVSLPLVTSLPLEQVPALLPEQHQSTSRSPTTLDRGMQAAVNRLESTLNADKPYYIAKTKDGRAIEDTLNAMGTAAGYAGRLPIPGSGVLSMIGEVADARDHNYIPNFGQRGASTDAVDAVLDGLNTLTGNPAAAGRSAVRYNRQLKEIANQKKKLEAKALAGDLTARAQYEARIPPSLRFTLP